MNSTEQNLNDTTIKTEQQSAKNECENTGKPKRTKWSDGDICKLKNLYEIDGKSASDLVVYFPNRTYEAIQIKIVRLKLRHTKEQQSKIWSEVRMGDKNPMFGKEAATKGHTKHTLEGLRLGGLKLSKIIKEKVARGEWRDVKGDNNPMYGKPSWSRGLTKETSLTISDAAKKCSKTKIENYKKLSPEERELKRLNIIRVITDEVRYKMRLAAIRRINNGGVLNGCRSYNKNACKYFNILNETMGWNLQHAENGGEVELYGYFLDAYDKTKNIVVEYDEPYHNKPSIYNKDLIRQSKIIEILKCDFYRYKESTGEFIKIKAHLSLKS
jgi:hypothetical protein